MTDASKIVKRLEFRDEHGDGVLTSRTSGELYRIFPQSSGQFMAPKLPLDEGIADNPQTLIDRLNQHHAAHILSALSPDFLASVAIMRAAIEVIAGGDGDAQEIAQQTLDMCALSPTNPEEAGGLHNG
jgi:hypothetical protein